MQEIALDCGYPASSLKERVYALKSPSGSYDRCGILIYTASTGAQERWAAWLAPRRGSPRYLKARFAGQRYAQMTPSALITSRTDEAATAQHTARPAMAAC
jgi:hypothetical protein